jgi:hypothetical protein
MIAGIYRLTAGSRFGRRPRKFIQIVARAYTKLYARCANSAATWAALPTTGRFGPIARCPSCTTFLGRMGRRHRRAGGFMAEEANRFADPQLRSYSAPAGTDIAETDDWLGGDAPTRRRWRQYAFGALAAICAGAAVYSSYVLSPRLLERVTDEWSWRSSFVGHSREPDPNGSGFGPSTATRYIREMKFERDGPVPDTVRITDDYAMYDVATGKVVWRYTIHPVVDRNTGARAEPGYLPVPAQCRAQGLCPAPKLRRWTSHALRQGRYDRRR